MTYVKKYVVLTIFFLFSILDCFCQENASINLGIMHRRSGNTYETYGVLQTGSKIHYYKSGFNPYFRVYSVTPKTRGMQIIEMEVESWTEDKMEVHKARRSAGSSPRIQFVDQYINENESRLVLILYYTLLSSTVQHEMRIEVELDKPFY